MTYIFPAQAGEVEFAKTQIAKLILKYIRLVRKSKKWKKNIFYLQRKNAKMHKEIYSLNQLLSDPTIIFFMTKLLANMESTRYHTKERNSTMLIKDFEIRDNLLKEAKDRGWL
jgi:hypothetical protein